MSRGGLRGRSVAALLGFLLLTAACSGDEAGPPAAEETSIPAQVLGAPEASEESVGPLLSGLPDAEARPEAAYDPDLDRLASQCQQGVVIGCDMLAAVSPPGSAHLEYAESCGGRNDRVLSCAVEYSGVTASVDAYDGEFLPEPGPPPSGADGDLDRLARECRDGDLLACDVLQFRTEMGSLHHAYASTCGARTGDPVVCTVWFRLVDPTMTIPTPTAPSS